MERIAVTVDLWIWRPTGDRRRKTHMADMNECEETVYVSVCITYTYFLHLQSFTYYRYITSSTAQGGGGSFRIGNL